MSSVYRAAWANPGDSHVSSQEVAPFNLSIATRDATHEVPIHIVVMPNAVRTVKCSMIGTTYWLARLMIHGNDDNALLGCSGVTTLIDFYIYCLLCTQAGGRLTLS